MELFGFYISDLCLAWIIFPSLILIPLLIYSLKQKKAFVNRKMKSYLVNLVRSGCPHCQGEFNLYSWTSEYDYHDEGYRKTSRRYFHSIICSKCNFTLYKEPEFSYSNGAPLNSYREGEGFSDWSHTHYAEVTNSGWKKLGVSGNKDCEWYIKANKIILDGFVPSEKRKLEHLC
mgnify:CR=1 FL=1